MLIGNGFNGNEVSDMLNALEENGVFIVIISETLGTVTGDDGTKLKVDDTFRTTSPYLVDSLYVVGGSSKNEAKFNFNMNKFIRAAYEHFKPIGVASTGQSFIQALEKNNLAGVVFAANNSNFGEEFVSSIAQQRFWDRK